MLKLRIFMIKKSFFIILLVILSALPAIFNLLLPGFPLTDDGNWMIIRFSAFYSTLSSGEFPVRFLSQLNNGFGYPVANFLYPLFMYLASPIHLLGVGLVDSVKIIIVLSIVLSGVFTFIWLRKTFDEISSFVGALVYVYFPYHLFDVYKRGSVGELLALAVFPFLLWQVKRKSIIGIAVGTSLLILAHNTLAILFISFIALYLLVEVSSLKHKEKFKELTKYSIGGIWGLGLSAFFWIPAVLELPFTVFSKVKVSDYQNYFANINLIGLFTFAIMIAVSLMFVNKKLSIKKNKTTFLHLVLSIITIFMALPISNIFWTFLPVSFIQFPFRVLSLSIVSTAFLAAVLVGQYKKKIKIALAVLISAIYLFSIVPFHTIFIQNLPDTFYSTNQDTTTVKNEYMPRWVNMIEAYNPQKVINLTSSENIELIKDKPNQIVFKIHNSKPTKIRVNTIYYPGWKASVNGEKVNINYVDNNGLITLNLNPGENLVVLKFEETYLRFIADLVSLLSVGLLIVYLLFIIKR